MLLHFLIWPLLKAMQVSVTNFRRFFGVFKEIIFLRLTDLYLLVSTIYYILDCINAGCRLHIDERLLFWQVDKACCRPFFVPWHTVLCNCSIRAPLFFIFLKMTNFQQSFFFELQFTDNKTEKTFQSKFAQFTWQLSNLQNETAV